MSDDPTRAMNLDRRVGDLAAMVDRLKGILRDVEWAGSDYPTPSCCPCCLEGERQGHADDCDLAKALRES